MARGLCCCTPFPNPTRCAACITGDHRLCPQWTGSPVTRAAGRASGLFGKYRVGRAARDIADHVEPTDDLVFEDQECGTWYGCRWKSHDPVLKDEGGACWWHNLCGHCGRRIVFKGSWDMGGEWIIDEHVIHEEAEI